MWKAIVAYTLMFLGFFVALFFKEYTGELIPYPFLFWIVGVAMIGIGILILRFTDPAEKSHRQQIEELKQHGDKVNVDFDSCELREHHYREEQEVGAKTPDFISLVSPMGYHAFSVIDSLKMEQVQVMQTVIIFSYQNNRTGEHEKFYSPVIPKDKITLSFYLDSQKKTNLYIDKINRNKYYFDLEFLYT